MWLLCYSSCCSSSPVWGRLRGTMAALLCWWRMTGESTARCLQNWGGKKHWKSHTRTLFGAMYNIQDGGIRNHLAHPVDITWYCNDFTFASCMNNMGTTSFILLNWHQISAGLQLLSVCYTAVCLWEIRLFQLTCMDLSRRLPGCAPDVHTENNMWSLRCMASTSSGCRVNGNFSLSLLLSFLFFKPSLTSLFYGEPSEKEKSPSESSPSDSETKDTVSFGLAL